MLYIRFVISYFSIGVINLNFFYGTLCLFLLDQILKTIVRVFLNTFYEICISRYLYILLICIPELRSHMVSTTDLDNYVLMHFDRQRVKRERVYFIYKINKKQNKTGGGGWGLGIFTDIKVYMGSSMQN